LAAPPSRYKVVDKRRFPGLIAFETRKVVFAHEYRIVVTHSEGFHQKQARGFEQTLAPRWLARVVSATLVGETPSELSLTWRSDQRAKDGLAEELFGKRVIFTSDRDEWSIADMVAGYRSQSEVEADFRQMKDRSVVSFSPIFHWTDQKIRVHAFYCVLALMVARLMTRETERAKMPMSVRELLSQLGGIEETVLLYHGERGRPRARRMLTEIDPTQQRLYDLFGLDEYAPTR
jgi:hypothetical protein